MSTLPTPCSPAIRLSSAMRSTIGSSCAVEARGQAFLEADLDVAGLVGGILGRRGELEDVVCGLVVGVFEGDRPLWSVPRG